MRRRTALLVAAALLAVSPALQARQGAAPKSRDFRFAVTGAATRADGGEEALKRALADAAQSDAAFVLATGIKSATEACSDRVYSERLELFEASERPLVVLPAGSDWTGCRSSDGRSSAVERLNRIRELYFTKPESLGTHRLALSRQSSVPKFRSYAENAHWEIDKVLFITANLPAKNNHFVTEAGRNSEYEDRMVATRAWLNRLFLLAKRKKLEGIVLLSDGDIGAHVEAGFFSRLTEQKDGFTETRRLVRSLAAKFPGKLLLVDAAHKNGKAAPAISWNGNIGHVGLSADWAEIKVAPGSAKLFSLAGE